MHVVLCQSIKGGCGKTLTAINVAHHLAKKYNVGLLDCDVDSPNLKNMVRIVGRIEQDEERMFIPSIWKMKGRNPIKVISAGMFGEGVVTLFKIGEEVRQILEDLILKSKWGDLDYLVCDLPAGSGDELRAVIQNLGLNLVGAILVTLPVTLEDCMRVVNLNTHLGVRIIGIIENQAYAICACGETPVCGGCGKVFNPLGAITKGSELTVERLSKDFDIPLLGKIPLIMGFSEKVAEGNPILPKNANKAILKAVKEIERRSKAGGV